MKQVKRSAGKTNSTNIKRILAVALGLLSLQFYTAVAYGQDCATSGNNNVTNKENTFYPGTQATVSAGATSITLGAAGSGTGFGNTPIGTGDIVLIIQMQGAQINVPASTTSALYGANFSGLGAGLTNANLYAGKMEFAVATNPVPLAGGTLSLTAGLTNAYARSAFGTYGQYTYQVIRVPHHYNIKLTSNVTAPFWNGSVGGLVVLNAVNQLDFNGKTISAVGAGFRGGGGRGFSSGAAGLSWKDYYSSSTLTANGSKGEGIAGTPRFINNNNVLLDNTAEGYPSGSYGRGAPGNAGGGATDSDPATNSQNAGGGGGGNGGAGGLGGNGWSSFKISGGIGGTRFQSYSPNTLYYAPSRLIMGGGGGSGSSNNSTGTPIGGFASSGSAGGGLVIVNALSIINSGTIDVSGAAPNSTVEIDGSGGGGAGGSILIYANSGLSNITARAMGGQGADNYPGNQDATQHGPGGGGGGGVIYANAALNAGSSSAGGAAGTSYGNTVTDNYGAASGANGVLVTSVPFAQLPPNMEICQIQVLPVTILDFNATYAAPDNAKIAWSTSNEINAAYFEVERSTNAIDFTSVAQVNAGTSGSQVNYYNANDQLAGINASLVYYRLKIVDQNGRFTYSKIVPVKLDQQAETSIALYPNPADSYTILNLSSDRAASGELRVLDNSGRQVRTKTFTVNNGNNSILIDQLGNLPKGLYLVQVMLNNNLYNVKLLKK